MKKLIIAVLFISVLSPLWSFDYYKSNILGMKMGPAESEPPENAEFLLRVETDSNREVQTLFKGIEIYFTRTIEQEGKKKTEITVKADVTETIVRRNGLVLSEVKKEENKPAESIEYSYKNGKLQSSEFYSDGKLVYTEYYNYTAERRLLDVKRVYDSDKEGVISSFMFKDGRIKNFWTRDGRSQSILKFDRGGVFFSEILSDDGWSDTREYGLDDEGRRFERIRNENGEMIYLLYSRQGRLLSSTSYDAEGERTETLIYQWNEDLLVKLTVKKELSTEKFSYEYDEQGMLKREIYIKNGNIMQETAFSGEDGRVETLYRYGKAVLRITYRGSERIETQQLQE